MRNKVVGRARSVFLITAVVFAIWANAVAGSFIYDDFALIADNQAIRSFHNIPLLFNSSYIASPIGDFFYRGSYNYGSGESTYRPVATLTYFLDYAVFGLKAWGYRLTNVLLHLLNALLLYLLLLELFANAELSFWAALIFGVHPVNAEIIACSGFRPNLLALLFSLLAVILYLRSADNSGRKRYFYLGSSLFCFILALFSKETAAFLPLILFVCEYYRQGQSLEKVRKNWKAYLCYLAAVAAFLGIYFFRMHPTQQIFRAAAFSGSLLRTIGVFGAYLKDIILPQDLVMVPPLGLRITLLEFWIGALFLIAAIAVLVRRKRLTPALSLGVSWFLIWLLPMNNPFNAFRIPLANRFMYLPLAGLAVVMAALLLIPAKSVAGKPDAKFSTLARLLPVACVVYFAIFALANSQAWKNDLLASLAVVEKYPASPTGHIDLGEAFLKRGNLEEARKEFAAAAGGRVRELSVFDFTRLYTHLGMTYLLQGEYGKAEGVYRQAIAAAPQMPYFHVLLAACYARQGLYERALEELGSAKKINPSYVPAYLKEAVVYHLMGRDEDARRELAEALRLDPASEEARETLERYKGNERR